MASEQGHLKLVDFGGRPQLVEAWHKDVLERLGPRCSNCGSEERLRVRMVVPEEAGGQHVATNGVVLCRTCDMARESLPRAGAKPDTYVVCIWMTHKLRALIEKLIEPKNTFRSWSSLARYLIKKYVTDEDRFDDLEQYQDGTSETKVTIRVEKAIYETFMAMLKKRGMTVTDALKGLLMMFTSGAGAVVNRRQR